MGGGKASDAEHKAILGRAVCSDTQTEAKLATMPETAASVIRYGRKVL
jgi:hypothetical protein